MMFLYERQLFYSYQMNLRVILGLSFVFAQLLGLLVTLVYYVLIFMILRVMKYV